MGINLKGLPKWLFAISLITFVAVVASLVISYVLFAEGTVQAKAKVDDYQEFYDSEYVQFSIYGTSQSQAEEFRSLECVDNVSSFSLCGGVELDANGKTYSKTIMIVESFEDLEGTPFAKERQINASGNTMSNPAILTYEMAQVLKLDVNDSVTLRLNDANRITVTISAIYGNNYVNSAEMVVLYAPNKASFDKIYTTEEKYNRCFVKTNDSEKFDAYLKENYQPKFDMKTRDDFAYDSEYAVYLERYNSIDYYKGNYIERVVSDPNYGADDLKIVKDNRDSVWYIIGLAIPIVGVMTAALYCLLIKPSKGSASSPIKYCIPHAASLVLSVAFIFAFSKLFSDNEIASAKVALKDGQSFMYTTYIWVAALIGTAFAEIAKVVATIVVINKK